MSKWTDEEIELLLDAADAVWEAHGVVVSNGGGAWSRHVEPAIYELRKVAGKLRPPKASLFRPNERWNKHKQKWESR